MGKGLNPADAFRKEEKKKAIKKSKKQQEEIKNIQNLLNDPKKINDEIEKLQKESQENRLDKSIKDKIKELESMRVVALKKEKIKNDALRMRESFLNPNLLADTKSSTTTNAESSSSPSFSSSFSSYSSSSASASSTSTSTDISETKQVTQSVYYHPVYNPTGAPPPGQQQIYKAATTNPTPPAIIQHPVIPLISQPQPISMHNVVVGGGSSGIPLPPPRPPLFQGMIPTSLPPTPQFMQQPMFHQQHQYAQQQPQNFMLQQQQQQHFLNQQHQQQQYQHQLMQPNRPHGRQPISIDPLDPTHIHYTERFQNSFNRPQPPSQQQSLVLSMNSSTSQLLFEEELEENRLIELRLAKLKGEILSCTSSSTTPLLANQSNTVQLQQPIPSVHISLPPTLNIPPPPQPPSFASLHDTIQKSLANIVDSTKTQQPPSLISTLLPLSASALEAIMNRRRNVETKEPTEPILASVLSDSATATTTTTMSPKTKKRKLGGDVLSGLLAYADDDEENEDSDGNEEEDEAVDDNAIKQEERASMNQSTTLLLPSTTATLPSSTMPIGPLPGPLPPIIDTMNSISSDYHSSYNHVTMTSGYDQGGTMIGSKKSKLLLVIKTDPSLRSFVPSSLRTKRLGDSSSINSIKLKPVSSEAVITEHQETNMTSSISSSTPIVNSSAVDDAYNDFLNEINQLT